MDERRLATQLEELQDDDESAIDELAIEAREKSFDLPREAVNIWIHGNSRSSEQAELMLDTFAELAIRPLIQIRDELSPSDQAWQLQTIVNAELNLRAQVLKLIEQAMNVVIPIPEFEPPGPIEEPIPVRRIRDHAYLLARQLTANESTGRQLFNEDAFLQMDMMERDAEVKRFRESRTWIDLIEDLDDLLDE